MRKPLHWREALFALGIIVVLALVLLPVLSRAREASRRHSCQNNLKMMGLVFKMYANESAGEVYPPRSPLPGNWIVDANVLYPEYMTDWSILVCPNHPLAREDAFHLRKNIEHPGQRVGAPHPNCVSGLYYTYLGHAIIHDDQALALYEASLVVPPELLGAYDVSVFMPTLPDNRGRVSNDIRAQSALPIMWDRLAPAPHPVAHRPAGINVLFMDGHVTFLRYSPYNAAHHFPATYVATETFARDVPYLSVDCY